MHKSSNVKTIAKRVDLRGRDIVAQGNRRDVYLIEPGEVGLHALEKPLVLKVPRYDERRLHPDPIKRLVARLLPSSLERVIRVEARYWEGLVADWGQDPATMPLPLFYGYVDTNFGPATLWESIWGADGTLAPDLADLFHHGTLSSAIEPLNRFAEFCFATNIVAPDIRSGNVVIAERAGRTQAVLIDGFGDMRLFSIRSLSPKRNLDFMTKRLADMGRSVGLDFDTERRTFSMPKG